MALIGDHKQLPPIVTSEKANAGGLGKSLFERLTEEGRVPSLMLDTQYRMHPSISEFPSGQFYDHAIRNGTIADIDRLRPPNSSRLEANATTGRVPSVVFLDHKGREAVQDRSRVNYNEGDIICGIVEDLLLQNEVSFCCSIHVKRYSTHCRN